MIPLPSRPVSAVPAALFALAALWLLPVPAGAQAVTRNLTLAAHLNEYPPALPTDYAYSACWSYLHGDGREYAILGTLNGTAIYNVTNPYAPYRTGLIPGPTSEWREMKTYRNWLYIVTEGSATGAGLQVVRMTDPEAPVLLGTYTVNFRSSHTVSIDTARAILICNGTRNSSGYATGMRILSLANPEQPVEIGWWPGGTVPVPSDQYVHDSVPIGNRLYASSIYAGIERIFDFTNPASPVEINSWTYPGGFTHNSWPDSSGNTLYVTDEVNGEPLKIFDISAQASPVMANQITSNPHAIVHNAHVKGRELYLSNYTEGIRVLDITDPVHPAEFAWADSWPGASGGFFGVWEVCPFFPSGTVIASDMQSGLYVYRPVRDYGLVRVEADTAGSPAAGIEVKLSPQGDSLATFGDGIAQFAPNPGATTVSAHRFGFYDASAPVTVTAGSAVTVPLSLAPRPRVDFSGKVEDAISLAGLLDAEVSLEVSPLHQHTGADGAFLFSAAPKDTYQVEVHRPGYVPLTFSLHLTPGVGPREIRLPRVATWDSLELATAWTVGGAGTGDNATTGLWTRVEPLGTGAPQLRAGRQAVIASRLEAEAGDSPLRDLLSEALASSAPSREREVGLYHDGTEGYGRTPGDVQPEFDRTPGAGTRCYVTGQGTNPGSIGENDVDNGKTSLTSPALDLTGMTDPVIGYWRWFYADGKFDDWLAVLVSFDNGANWTPVDTTYGSHAGDWEERAIHVGDFGAPTAQMRVRFVAADLSPGSIVEAAVDDIVTYDGATATVVTVPGALAPARLELRGPWPNPSPGGSRLSLALPAAGRARVEVLDLAGRLVRVLHDGEAPAGTLPLAWDGADASGRRAPAGLYFVRAAAGGAVASARLVRVD